MRKLYTVVFALLALFAFGAMTATSAFAVELTFELAEWLVSGAKILEGEKLATEASGALTLLNETNGGTLLCEGIFDGFVESNGKDSVTEVLNTSKEATGTLTAGLAIACMGSGTCLSDAEVWAENLPWETLLELDVQDGTFWDLFVGKLPIYHAKCLTIIGTQEEECLAVTGSGFEKLNLATDVEEMGLATPLGNCGGGTGNGDITAVEGNLTFLTSGLSLQVSE